MEWFPLFCRTHTQNSSLLYLGCEWIKKEKYSLISYESPYSYTRQVERRQLLIFSQRIINYVNKQENWILFFKFPKSVVENTWNKSNKKKGENKNDVRRMSFVNYLWTTKCCQMPFTTKDANLVGHMSKMFVSKAIFNYTILKTLFGENWCKLNDSLSPLPKNQFYNRLIIWGVFNILNIEFWITYTFPSFTFWMALTIWYTFVYPLYQKELKDLAVIQALFKSRWKDYYQICVSQLTHFISLHFRKLWK